MNKYRRKLLKEVLGILQQLNDSYLQKVLIEEQEAYDNMPENLQMSTNGDKIQEAINDLEGIISDLEDVTERLETLLE